MADTIHGLSDRRIILASASTTRADMLRGAGVEVEVVPSSIDEAAIVDAVAADGDGLPPADIAALLARSKAEEVAGRYPHALVLGADQTLDLEGRLFSKPGSIEEARRNLLTLRGKTHALHASVALAGEGRTVWHHTATAWVTLRDFTPQFLGRYIAAVGDRALDSVGSYQIEGLGAQLFASVEGDWFTILGLPLLPLLQELRRREVIPS